MNGCGGDCEVEENDGRGHLHDSKVDQQERWDGGVMDCENEGLGPVMGMDKYVEMRGSLNRNDVCSEVGHSDGPILDLEEEVTGGYVGCNVGTYPCVMGDQIGLNWWKWSPRGAR